MSSHSQARGPCRKDSSPHRRRLYSGFTLIELVVVIIILGVLAAVAVPKLVDMSSAARVASLKTLSAALQMQSENLHAACKLNPACTETGSFSLYFDGNPAYLIFGWPEAGDTLNGGEIDSWILYTGFTASLPDSHKTLFTLDGAPNPANCTVNYAQAVAPLTDPVITTTASGC